MNVNWMLTGSQPRFRYMFSNMFSYDISGDFSIQIMTCIPFHRFSFEAHLMVSFHFSCMI